MQTTNKAEPVSVGKFNITTKTRNVICTAANSYTYATDTVVTLYTSFFSRSEKYIGEHSGHRERADRQDTAFDMKLISQLLNCQFYCEIQIKLFPTLHLNTGCVR